MSPVIFQMPEKILVEKVDNFQGIFTFQPLEKGYGVTLGNSLRRILISSLEGYAITAIKIFGVQHEFATIDGMREDVTEMTLNLKQVRFKKRISNPNNPEEKIFLSVKNTSIFRAGDIAQSTPSFEILNPDLIICNLDKPTSFDLEITVAQGRGYLPAEENQPKGQILGLIPVDAIFTPIKNVAYRVENTRVAQKIDYEKLIIVIHTDGSIHPEAALKEAAYIMIRHLSLITGEDTVLHAYDAKEEEVLDEERLRIGKLIKTPINELNFSARVLNCLNVAGIKTLGDLTKLELSDMMKFRNFGKKSREEIDQLLADKNLEFGMDLSLYKI